MSYYEVDLESIREEFEGDMLAESQHGLTEHEAFCIREAVRRRSGQRAFGRRADLDVNPIRTPEAAFSARRRIVSPGDLEQRLSQRAGETMGAAQMVELRTLLLTDEEIGAPIVIDRSYRFARG